MKVLVTGGTGFIGTHLVDELVKRGEEVRSLVRETSNIVSLKRREKFEESINYWNNRSGWFIFSRVSFEKRL